MSDPLVIASQEFGSRLFLGTAGYPNRKLMLDAIAASGTQMVTASIRRISLAGDDESLVELLAGRVRFLPNTAGCQTAKDAVLDCRAGARSPRHQLGEARSDRRPRIALSRRRGTCSRHADAGCGGFCGVALLHRRPGDLPKTRRRWRRGRDAARLADRVRSRHLQSAPDRAHLCAFSGAGCARRRHRHRVRRHARHGTRLRRSADQHCGIESARSVDDGV